ncbi:MAG: HAMP domain-containing protein [Candidatus Omnitrophota bacterium]
MKNDFQKRRRLRIVRMQFQRGFILKFCAVTILSSLALSAIVYWSSASATTTVFQNSRLQIQSTADFLLPLLLLSSLIAVIASAIATIIITLLTSHRIAGPLVRIKKDIAEIANGNFGVSFHIRQKDELQDLVDSLNQMAKAIHDNIGQIRREIESIPVFALDSKEREKIEMIKSQLKKFNC